MTDTLVPIVWWTSAELLLGILCPCLVTFRPLFRSAHAIVSSRLGTYRKGYARSKETNGLGESGGSNGKSGIYMGGRKSSRNHSSLARMTIGGSDISGGGGCAGGKKNHHWWKGSGRGIGTGASSTDGDEEFGNVFVGGKGPQRNYTVGGEAVGMARLDVNGVGNGNGFNKETYRNEIECV